MKIVEVKADDREYIEKVVVNENEHFDGLGAADMWLIKGFIRYGKVYILVDENENLLSVSEYMQVFGKNEVFLYGFSTAKAFQRKGYGKTLLREGEKLLKKQGIKKIILTVDPLNIGAVELYKNLGYSVVELQRDEYGRGVDRYLMEKPL